MKNEDRFGLPKKSRFAYWREGIGFWMDDRWFGFRMWCASHGGILRFLLGVATGFLSIRIFEHFCG